MTAGLVMAREAPSLGVARAVMVAVFSSDGGPVVVCAKTAKVSAHKTRRNASVFVCIESAPFLLPARLVHQSTDSA